MSERNVELHRRCIEAFNMRDVDAFIAYCDPGIQAHSAFDYEGHDGVRRWNRGFREAWGDEIRLGVEAYFDLGERTLGFHTLHGRGKHSGVEVAMPSASVTTWHDGQCVALKAYAHRDDALSDLGVTQDELEPIAP